MKPRFPKAVLVVAAVALLLMATPVLAALVSPIPVSGTVSVESNSGTTVSVSGASELETNNLFVDSQTVRIETNDGAANFSSASDTAATVASADLEGTSTDITSTDASGADLTINPDDKPSVTVGGGVDSIAFRSMAVGDNNEDFQYSASSSGTITVRGLAGGQTVTAVDTDSGTTIDGATVSGSGVATFDVPSGTYSRVVIRSNQAPSVTNIQPSGDLTQTPDNVTATISDDSLPGSQVNVSVELDGTQIGTATATSDGGTVSVPLPNTIDGGGHTIAVTANDSAGASTVETESFNVPATLEIRNESDPSQLINGTGVTVEVTFFGDDQVFRRSTSDGTINLTGLPVSGQPFVVQVQTDGYVQRRAVIESIYQQNTAYLLPENTTAVQTRFVLEDNTGQFDASSTRLFVSKPLTINGSVEYKVVAADTFGSAGFTTTLEQGERYQLRVVNDDGDSRALGAYQATLNETVTLTVGELSFPVTAEQTYSVNGTAITDSQGTQTAVKFSFAPATGDSAESLDITIHERYNDSNIIYTETVAPVSGNLSRTVMLSGDEQNKTWVADYTIDRGDEDVSGTVPLSGRQFGTGLPLEQGLLSIFSTGFLLLLGGLFSRANAAVGALVIPLAAGALWMAELVPPEVTGVSIILAFGVAVLYRLAIADTGAIP